MYHCVNITLSIFKHAAVWKNNLKNVQICSFRYIFTMGSIYVQKSGLPNYHTDVKEMAAAGDRTGTARDQNEKGNGLLLYLNHYSFYAQKVIMALIEKRLPFKSHVVNIVKGEQYKPWFLEINPRGEVPVLKDGVKIIPDSARIIDYLEDNFSNGDTLRLIPMDQGPEVRQKVIHFRNILDQIPANVVTLGSFYHTKFVHKPKMPFIAPVRKQLAVGEEKNIQKLRELAEVHPEIKDILLEKAEVQEKKHNIIVSEEQYAKLLDQVDSVLKEIEKELSSRSEQADMIFMYGEFMVMFLRRHNSTKKHFLVTQPPNHKTYAAMFQQLRKSGTLVPFSGDRGRKRHLGTPHVEEKYLATHL